MHPFSVLLNAAFLLLSCSSQDPSETKQEPRKQVQDAWLVTTTATVEAIDHKTRVVTIKGPQGNTFTFKADESVKNLDQVKVGDRIVVNYYQSLAIQVVKVGTKDGGQETTVESAEEGEKPAVTAAKKMSMIATVEEIDHSAPSITLKDSKGTVTTVKVRHPERLKLVKVGDTLKITYREAVAISVEPAPKEAR